MAKTANLYARIEPEIKEEAEKILDALGIPASNAITMFYKQIIFHNGLPFDVKIPVPFSLDISTMSEEELDEKLEKGFTDILEGKTRNADEAFADIRNKIGL